MFNKVLKERGIDEGIWLVFRPTFDKEIVKEAGTFVGKQWIGTQITGGIGWVINLLIIIKMPQMSSWSGLLMIPLFVGHLTNMAGPMGSTAVPALSEAWNNGKKKLAQYFLHDLLKWYTFLTLFLATSLWIIVPRLLHVIVKVFPTLANYEAGIVIIPVIIIIEATNPFRALWRRVFVACNEPMPPIYVGYVFTIPGYALQFLFIYLCIDIAVLPVWYLLIIPMFLTDLMSSVMGFIWMQRKVIKINFKQIFWQVIAAPAITAVIYAGLLIIFNNTIWVGMELICISLFGYTLGLLIPAVLVLLAMLFLFPGIFFSPVYSLLGGWDDFTLEEFRKCALISGPSKGITMLMYKISAKFAKLSKWSNKFPIADYAEVEKEIKEIMDEGHANKLLNLGRH